MTLLSVNGSNYEPLVQASPDDVPPCSLTAGLLFAAAKSAPFDELRDQSYSNYNVFYRGTESKKDTVKTLLEENNTRRASRVSGLPC
jgi:hypothetical protein